MMGNGRRRRTLAFTRTQEEPMNEPIATAGWVALLDPFGLRLTLDPTMAVTPQIASHSEAGHW